MDVMHKLLPALLMALAMGPLLPGAVQAQGDLLQSIRQGGGWVEIPISGGSGKLQTEAVPTLGLTITGCMTVWPGHSGVWSLEARDRVNGGRLDVTASPGEGVPFSYRTGLRSLLDVQVQWSEARDTTLILWVGLEGTTRTPRDACAPVYGNGEERSGPVAVASPHAASADRSDEAVRVTRRVDQVRRDPERIEGGREGPHDDRVLAPDAALHVAGIRVRESHREE